MERVNKMAVTPMPRLVLGMSLPLMVSLLVQSLYNIVDSIFVARPSENVLAATSLSFPVQMLWKGCPQGDGAKSSSNDRKEICQGCFYPNVSFFFDASPSEPCCQPGIFSTQKKNNPKCRPGLPMNHSDLL